MICTFFGHRDAPLSIEKELEKIILSLISEGVDEFLVGNNGSFDLLAAPKKAYIRQIISPQNTTSSLSEMLPLVMS